MAEARSLCARRRMTFRALVIDALVAELARAARRDVEGGFRLRDASAGYVAEGAAEVSAEVINRAIDEQREADATG